MRLAYCARCECMSKLPDFTGRTEHDASLQDWIDRHMHGFTEDEHPGGQLFTYDVQQSDIDRRVVTEDGRFIGEASADEMEAVQAARSELRKIGKEVDEYRDELRIDATMCHRKHGQPSFPGKPCIDYRSEKKLIGRRNLPKDALMYVCTMCPYQVSVTVEIRRRRGDYAESAGLRRRR